MQDYCRIQHKLTGIGIWVVSINLSVFWVFSSVREHIIIVLALKETRDCTLLFDTNGSTVNGELPYLSYQ